MKTLLLTLGLILSAGTSLAETQTQEINGITIGGKSTCPFISDQSLINMLGQQLSRAPHPVIPPNQRGMRIVSNFHCDTPEQAGGHVLYTGAVALEVLARVDRPFSDNYWLPIYDYKIYGIKTKEDLPSSFAMGVNEFIGSMKNVTPTAYRGFGLQPPR
ncbi:hypothetical protein IMCC21906_02604 [Spongiibacter sp. IMCC21906]|uniref:hypothetical protein n=1 Tax=Spongiibacter sp. IMCC21906 TaxID=1620392 RepID=UPI00062DD5FF|nr:hypothetical protein [Spongiibacter sp. IMCC21906]AKH70249.1 hypothetical protein IMCC21906_02604 [Spongiibacter sp. IMCC21906]